MNSNRGLLSWHDGGSAAPSAPSETLVAIALNKISGSAQQTPLQPKQLGHPSRLEALPVSIND